MQTEADQNQTVFNNRNISFPFVRLIFNTVVKYFINLKYGNCLE